MNNKINTYTNIKMDEPEQLEALLNELGWLNAHLKILEERKEKVTDQKFRVEKQIHELINEPKAKL